MQAWYAEQCQFWKQAWSLCKQRALLLVCWCLAVTLMLSVGGVVWQVLLQQLHVSGLAPPAMVWRVLVVMLLAEYAMTVLTFMLASPQHQGYSVEHCLTKSYGVFSYVLSLRCLMWLAIAVATLLLFVPGVLLAIFCSIFMIDVLQHDVKGMFALRRMMLLWRGHRWQVMRVCGLGYVVVMALLAATVWLFFRQAPSHMVQISFMLLLVGVVMVRCLQAVFVSQFSELSLVLDEDRDVLIAQDV